MNRPTRPVPKICTSRFHEPYAECGRPFDHEGWHRAQLAEPVTYVDHHGLTHTNAQVISWAPD